MNALDWVFLKLVMAINIICLWHFTVFFAVCTYTASAIVIDFHVKGNLDHVEVHGTSKSSPHGILLHIEIGVPIALEVKDFYSSFQKKKKKTSIPNWIRSFRRQSFYKKLGACGFMKKKKWERFRERMKSETQIWSRLKEKK